MQVPFFAAQVLYLRFGHAIKYSAIVSILVVLSPPKTFAQDCNADMVQAIATTLHVKSKDNATDTIYYALCDKRGSSGNISILQKLKFDLNFSKDDCRDVKLRERIRNQETSIEEKVVPKDALEEYFKSCGNGLFVSAHGDRNTIFLSATYKSNENRNSTDELEHISAPDGITCALVDPKNKTIAGGNTNIKCNRIYNMPTKIVVITKAQQEAITIPAWDVKALNWTASYDSRTGNVKCRNTQHPELDGSFPSSVYQAHSNHPYANMTGIQQSVCSMLFGSQIERETWVKSDVPQASRIIRLGWDPKPDSSTPTKFTCYLETDAKQQLFGDISCTEDQFNRDRNPEPYSICTSREAESARCEREYQRTALDEFYPESASK